MQKMKLEGVPYLALAGYAIVGFSVRICFPVVFYFIHLVLQINVFTTLQKFNEEFPNASVI